MRLPSLSRSLRSGGCYGSDGNKFPRCGVEGHAAAHRGVSTCCRPEDYTTPQEERTVAGFESGHRGKRLKQAEVVMLVFIAAFVILAVFLAICSEVAGEDWWDE